MEQQADDSALGPQSGVVRAFHKWVFTLNGIGTIWIFLVMVLMNIDIFMRFLFGTPIDGVTEIVEVSIGGIVFLQLSDAVRAGRLTRSDGLFNKLKEKSPKLGHIFGIFFDSCGALFFTIILAGGIPKFWDAWKNDFYAGSDGIFTIALWPLRLILVIGCITVIFVFIGFVQKHVSALKELSNNNSNSGVA